MPREMKVKVGCSESGIPRSIVRTKVHGHERGLEVFCALLWLESFPASALTDTSGLFGCERPTEIACVIEPSTDNGNAHGPGIYISSVLSNEIWV